MTNTFEEDPNRVPGVSPLQLIALFRRDPNAKDEFCYANKRHHPYDWVIVDFEARNPQEYTTVSSQVNSFTFIASKLQNRVSNITSMTRSLILLLVKNGNVKLVFIID